MSTAGIGAEQWPDAEAIDPVALALLLSVLPVDHRLVTWAVLGLEIAAGRDGVPRLDDDYIGGRWYRANVLAEYSELQLLRYPPTGDRDLWVKYGPAGPPCVAVEEKAA